MGVGQDEGTGGGIPGDGSPTKVLVASTEGGRGGVTTAPHLAFAVTLGVPCLMITVAQTWTGSPNELAKQTAIAFCLSFRMYTSTADPPTPSVCGVVDCRSSTSMVVISESRRCLARLSTSLQKLLHNLPMVCATTARHTIGGAWVLLSYVLVFCCSYACLESSLTFRACR